MRNTSSLLRILVLGALPLVACQGKGPHEGPAIGSAAPSFGGKSLSGRYLHVEDFRGKVLLVNLWATWCPPCRDELPTLQKLHETLGPRGFSVVGVSVDAAHAEEQVQRVVREFGLAYPIMLDPSARATALFEAGGYPTNILIGRSGQVLWRRPGVVHENDEEFLEHVEAALAAPMPRAP